MLLVPLQIRAAVTRGITPWISGFCLYRPKPLIFNGAPGKIRTPDPQIRSLVLYPAELAVLPLRLFPSARLKLLLP